MTIIGIALYMYLLYKEVKLFQDEIVVMKAQIAHMQTTQLTQPSPPKVIEIAPKAIEIENEIEEEEDDDSHSVTSNEIKNILTNINDDSEDEEDEQNVPDEPTISHVPKTPEDLSKMSVEELTLLKYDVLREYLRLQKKNIKGTKAELVKRISELA